MAIVQIHELPGMTREQYEQALRALNLSGPPPGSHLHAGGPTESGWRIVEVWESEEAANAFYGSDPFQQMVRSTGIPAPTITNHPVETVTTTWTPASPDTAISTPPPPAVLLQMMTGYWLSQAVYIAAKLGVADLLVDGPRSVEPLATATASHPSSLYRLLRALASVGVFTETSPHTFALTPMAQLLCTDTPGSMRSLAVVYNEELYQAWGHMLHSIRTGEPAFAHHFGMGPFPYFAENPEAGHIFNEAMIGYTHEVANGVAGVYDFSPFRTVVDVGGGYGTLLATILRANPATGGILFDLPHVIDAAEPFLAASGVGDRCTRSSGDFFVAVPEGGDAYVFSQILHDWEDEQCLTILKHTRQVIPAHGKLLLVELVIPAGNEPSFGKWLDLHMLAIPGGRERTEAEYAAIFRDAGFALTNIVPTPAGPSVVEAVPV
jgi:hypothetical protein